MARERINGGNITPEKFVFLEEIKGGARQLFGIKKPSQLLTPDQANYFEVKDQLEKMMKGEPYKEVSLKQLASFFKLHYELLFKKQCIDYNWFNFQSTAKKVKEYLNLENNVALSYFFIKSMTDIKANRFKELEDFPTLSTYKTGWKLNILAGKTVKFDGFY